MNSLCIQSNLSTKVKALKHCSPKVSIIEGFHYKSTAAIIIIVQKVLHENRYKKASTQKVQKIDIQTSIRNGIQQFQGDVCHSCAVWEVMALMAEAAENKLWNIIGYPLQCSNKLYKDKLSKRSLYTATCIGNLKIIIIAKYITSQGNHTERKYYKSHCTNVP